MRPTLEFLAELRRRFPFPIHKIQTDHGAEFALEFVLAVEEAGIRHRYIRPRRPQQKGKVERSQRVDHGALWDWERTYNLDRLSLALHGETLAEKLARLRPGTRVA